MSIRLFIAGGNHSIFMLDEFSPFPFSYKWPELLKSQKDRALSKSAKSITKEQTSSVNGIRKEP